MRILDIINLIGIYNVPIFTIEKHEIKGNCCFSIMIPTDELAEIRNKKATTHRNTGVYFYNCTYSEFYNLSKEINSEAVSQIIELIKQNFEINDEDEKLAFSLFSILHEIGHVHHFLNSKMSYREYWINFYKDWEELWIMYQFEYNIIATTSDEKSKTNLKYGKLYRGVALEKVADDFAINNFKDAFLKIKHT